MLKFAFSILVLLSLTACRNQGKTPGQKLDTLLKQVDTTAGQFIDSARSKTKALTREIENRFSKKDSSYKDTSGRR
jgi:ElaB/YqjD/DUF883 family membrane-anchored ribosome-binding protein